MNASPTQPIAGRPRTRCTSEAVTMCLPSSTQLGRWRGRNGWRSTEHWHVRSVNRNPRKWRPRPRWIGHRGDDPAFVARRPSSVPVGTLVTDIRCQEHRMS